MNLQEILKESAARLKTLTETPALDAGVLLVHICNKNSAWLLAHPEADLTPQQAQDFEEKLKALEAGTPLPYVLGHWEFFGLDFLVTPDTLIPRPETELLVEKALDWLKAHPACRKAVEVGAGSGCISLSLAAHIPDLRVTATDISPAALKVARENASRLHLTERVNFLHCDLLPDQPEAFQLLVSNPPYIPTQTLTGLKVSSHEPKLALDGGPDGLSVIRRLLAQSCGRLPSPALILIEIEAGQGASARQLAETHFPNAKTTVHKDLSGRERLLEIVI